MSWLHGVVIFIVFLFAGSQQISGLEGVGHHGHRVERSEFSDIKVKQVLKVLENLPGYYEQAVQLWQTLDQICNIFSTTSRVGEIDTDARLDALNNKVDRFATDVQALKENLFKNLENKNNRKSVEEKLGTIMLKLEIVNKNFFTRFLEYTNSKNSGLEWYILKWVDEVLDSNAGLAEPLITIKTSLLAGLVDVDRSYNNILDLLAAPNLVSFTRHTSSSNKMVIP